VIKLSDKKFLNCI